MVQGSSVSFPPSLFSSLPAFLLGEERRQRSAGHGRFCTCSVALPSFPIYSMTMLSSSLLSTHIDPSTTSFFPSLPASLPPSHPCSRLYPPSLAPTCESSKMLRK